MDYKYSDSELVEIYKAENHELHEILRMEQEIHMEKCKEVQRLRESIETLISRYRVDIVDNEEEANAYISVVGSLQNILDGIPV